MLDATLHRSLTELAKKAIETCSDSFSARGVQEATPAPGVANRRARSRSSFLETATPNRERRVSQAMMEHEVP